MLERSQLCSLKKLSRCYSVDIVCNQINAYQHHKSLYRYQYVFWRIYQTTKINDRVVRKHIYFLDQCIFINCFVWVCFIYDSYISSWETVKTWSCCEDDRRDPSMHKMLSIPQWNTITTLSHKQHSTNGF